MILGSKKIILLVVLILMANPGDTTNMTMQQAQNFIKSENLQLPSADKDGTFHTLNKKGVSSPKLDQISLAFLKEIDSAEKDALEIGSAFGNVALRALLTQVKSFTASDLDKRHIALFAQQAQKHHPQHVHKLKLLYGNFPADYQNVPDHSFDTILIAKVLHFFTPDQATKALKEVFRLLKPGGKIFIVAITPYVNRFKSFIPLYKQRLLLKHQYPGHVKNLKYFADPEATTPEQLAQMHDKSFMFFDAQFMHSFLSEMGFVVEKSLEFPLAFKSSIWELDGREFVGAIAHKPINHPLFSTPAP